MRLVVTGLVSIALIVASVYAANLFNAPLLFCCGALLAASVVSGKEILSLKIKE
jgi:hypothetical protein